MHNPAVPLHWNRNNCSQQSATGNSILGARSVDSRQPSLESTPLQAHANNFAIFEVPLVLHAANTCLPGVFWSLQAEDDTCMLGHARVPADTTIYWHAFCWVGFHAARCRKRLTVTLWPRNGRCLACLNTGGHLQDRWMQLQVRVGMDAGAAERWCMSTRFSAPCRACALWVQMHLFLPHHAKTMSTACTLTCIPCQTTHGNCNLMPSCERHKKWCKLTSSITLHCPLSNSEIPQAPYQASATSAASSHMHLAHLETLCIMIGITAVL